MKSMTPMLSLRVNNIYLQVNASNYASYFENDETFFQVELEDIHIENSTLT